MSHLIIARSAPPLRAPDRQAIVRLDDAIARKRVERRQRSLATCHRPARRETLADYAHTSAAYVPQFSSRLLNDPRLSDGARRCAIKLMEIAYRKDRAGRSFRGTVLYLAKCLSRSERAVQTYLAQLREGGYIRHEVVRSERARMCIGILVTLLEPLFPRHHRNAWPDSARSGVNSGVKRDSEKYSPKTSQRQTLTVEHWTMLCMDGVFRGLMKTLAPQGTM